MSFKEMNNALVSVQRTGQNENLDGITHQMAMADGTNCQPTMAGPLAKIHSDLSLYVDHIPLAPIVDDGVRKRFSEFLIYDKERTVTLEEFKSACALVGLNFRNANAPYANSLLILNIAVYVDNLRLTLTTGQQWWKWSNQITSLFNAPTGIVPWCGLSFIPPTTQS